MNITEPEVERPLAQRQHVTMRAPVDRRQRSRQVIRGMRCELSAWGDGVTLDGLRVEL